MAHVAIGQILGTTHWRVERGATFHYCDTEETARVCADQLATGGLQIVATSFHLEASTVAWVKSKFSTPTFKADVIAAAAASLSASSSASALEGDAPSPEAPRITGLSIRKLKSALETGDYDAFLEGVSLAERAGRNRAGALEAIQARVDAIAGE